jgi:hypothetical protein
VDYVQLDRRFRDLTAKELEDPSILALLGDEREDGLGWEAIFESRRTVLFAEAGSGKTEEMRQAARRLSESGRYAVFVPIEALHDEDVRSVLAMEPGEETRFDAWLAQSNEPGWFLLDAVDELKLAHGKLDTALGKLVRSLGDARPRARLVLSCRPTDWQPITDLDTLNRRFPPPPPATPKVENADDVFLSALRRRQQKAEQAPPQPRDLRTVVLLPLDRPRIKRFVRSCGVQDVDAFLAEVTKHEAWSFARRPLDLDELATNWMAKGRLGTRLEQHITHIESNLRERPDRADDALLSRDKARVVSRLR